MPTWYMGSHEKCLLGTWVPTKNVGRETTCLQYYRRYEDLINLGFILLNKFKSGQIC